MKSKSKYQRKLELLKITPCCPSCGNLMIALNSNPPQGIPSQAAIIRTENGKDSLLCFQCHRLSVKETEIRHLPLFKRIKVRLEQYFGIITLFKRTKASINKFIYFRIKRGKPTGRLPIECRK